MDALEYCRQKAAPEGSAGYYATVFLAPAARAGVLAVHALERELIEVVEACSEAAVAERKLDYWREELLHALEERPTHPVTHALCRHAPGALDARSVAGLLAAVHARIVEPQVRTTADLDAACRATAGALGRVAARLLAPGDAAFADALDAVASAAERLRLLSMPRRAGHPPHAGIALELLARAEVTPQQVDAGGHSAGLVALRRALLEQVRERLAASARALTAPRGYAATRSRIARVQLTALERGGYVERGTARRALPVVLLWHAWRHRPAGTR